MLDALLNPILPVFAIMALGAVLARVGLFTVSDAAVINRFVVYVCIPALMIRLIGTADFADFHWPVIGIFLLSEAIVYAIGYVVARKLFGIEVREAILLGFGACFANNLFFVLPIASILFGEAAGTAAVALLTMDTLIVFGGTFILVDVISSQRNSALGASLAVLKNPITVILLIAWGINLLGVPLHPGVITFSEFAGNAAAPTALFAMGIVVSQASLSVFDSRAAVFAALKLLIHPLIAFAILHAAGIVDGESGTPWSHTMLMVTAGPLGVMPFVIAMQHNISTDRLLRAIIYSSVVSVVTLSLVATMIE